MEAGGFAGDPREELKRTEHEGVRDVGMDDYQTDFATEVENGEAKELLRMLV